MTLPRGAASGPAHPPRHVALGDAIARGRGAAAASDAAKGFQFLDASLSMPSNAIGRPRGSSSARQSQRRRSERPARGPPVLTISRCFVSAALMADKTRQLTSSAQRGACAATHSASITAAHLLTSSSKTWALSAPRCDARVGNGRPRPAPARSRPLGPRAAPPAG